MGCKVQHHVEPNPPRSPCCNAEVVELRDRTEYWLVKSINNEETRTAYARATADSDFRAYECDDCGAELTLAAGRFIPAAA
jgi:ssDNA-binding Zn-finger/Zn-ribbon topoisomerase 1